MSLAMHGGHQPSLLSPQAEPREPAIGEIEHENGCNGRPPTLLGEQDRSKRSRHTVQHALTSAITVISASEFCSASEEGERADFLLGPLIAKPNRTLIAGPTGEGKTTLAYQMLRAVSVGDPFLGWRGRGGCRVLIVDLEQGARTLRRRLREFGLDRCQGVELARIPDGLCLDKDADQVKAFAALLSGGYDVVLIDPLYKTHAGDSNDERSAVDLMRLLDGWRERFGFALVLVAHCRKPLAAQAHRLSIHDIFGSSAYVRGAEVVLGIRRVKQGCAQLHFFKDRDGDLPVAERWGLLFAAGEGFRRDPDDGRPRLTAVDKVRELLIRQPWELTKDDLVARTERKSRTVEKALADLSAFSRPLGDSRSQHVYALPQSDDGVASGASCSQ